MGADTVYTYTNAAGGTLATKTAKTNGRWVRTTFDGFNRPVKVEIGDCRQLSAGPR